MSDEPKDQFESATEDLPENITTGTDPDATDAAPENTLPVDPAQLEPEVVGVRTGMFGVEGTGDTSGYGGLVRPVTMPGGSQRPYGGWFDEVVDELARAVGDQGAGAIEKVVVHRGEITIFVRREHLLTVAQHLRDDEKLRFEFCSGVSGVHYPDDTGRELHAV